MTRQKIVVRAPQPGVLSKLSGALVACAALVAWAPSAAAYVIVTIDNKVFQIASKPEVRGSLVLFTLDGAPVSLRIFDVNVAKTNELNAMLDRGGSGRDVIAAVRALPERTPIDDRIIVASRLHRDMLDQDDGGTRSFGSSPTDTFTRDTVGPRRPPITNFDAPMRSPSPPQVRTSPFADEARRALDDARLQTAPASRTQAPPVITPASPRASDRLADLDAELAAEQAYLRQLTAGEVTVDDLDNSIKKSMQRIRKLQAQRDKAAGTRTRVETEMAPEIQTVNPPGSREAKWEREIAEKQARLNDLRGQQAGATGDDREAIDYMIAQAEFELDKLQRKLEKSR